MASCDAPNSLSAQVLGFGPVEGVTNENDLSMVALIRFGSFDYLWASEPGRRRQGGGLLYRAIHQSGNLETPLAKALTPGGTTPELSEDGIPMERSVLALGNTMLGTEHSGRDLLLAPKAQVLPLNGTLRSQTPFRRGRVSMLRI